MHTHTLTHSLTNTSTNTNSNTNSCSHASLFGWLTRPGPVAQIFLEYTSIQESLTAQRALSGRRFANRSVVTSFYDEDKFANDDLE